MLAATTTILFAIQPNSQFKDPGQQLMPKQLNRPNSITTGLAGANGGETTPS